MKGPVLIPLYDAPETKPDARSFENEGSLESGLSGSERLHTSGWERECEHRTQQHRRGRGQSDD